MTDVLVDEALGTTYEGDTLPDGRRVFVCHWPSKTNPDVPCGATFQDPEEGRRDALPRWNSHCQSVHRTDWRGNPTAKTGQKSKDGDQEPKTATKAEKQAAKKATGSAGGIVTDSNRAAIYAQSLASLGLMAHLAAGRYFDDYDLNVWSNGTPGLANALDACGEVNPGMRRTCDLLLAGGTGGAYVQLFLAATMVAVPIAAHHGFLPAAAGERFGAMIGAMAPGEAAPAPSAAPPGPPVRLDGTIPVDQWTYDQWREVLFASATNPDAQRVMMEMMGMAQGPIDVTIPDMPGTTPMDIPQEEHRGTVGTDNGTTGGPAEESVPATP